MELLTISQVSITPYQIPLISPFIFAGNTISQREGFYLTVSLDNGISVQSEAAPLPGISQETLRHCKHDLEEIQTCLKEFKIDSNKKALINKLKQEGRVSSLCPSARFAVESSLFLLAAKSQNLSLAEFLESPLVNVSSACLLQGNYDQVMSDAKLFSQSGYRVFKLKVGDRNIPLDVKKVNDLRKVLPKDALLRLDGNRVWSLKEALIFTELIGHEKIEFIEEPLSDMGRLNELYQATHIPVALDETLSVVTCGVNAPGRCSPTLAHHEAVKAYILKPMVLGFLKTLDWIEEARSLGKKAIISSSFESMTGLKILANLALLCQQTAGLGTERWFKGDSLVNHQGIIQKENLL